VLLFLVFFWFSGVRVELVDVGVWGGGFVCVFDWVGGCSVCFFFGLVFFGVFGSWLECLLFG